MSDPFDTRRQTTHAALPVDTNLDVPIQSWFPLVEAVRQSPLSPTCTLLPARRPYPEPAPEMPGRVGGPSDSGRDCQRLRDLDLAALRVGLSDGMTGKVVRDARLGKRRVKWLRRLFGAEWATPLANRRLEALRNFAERYGVRT